MKTIEVTSKRKVRIMLRGLGSLLKIIFFIVMLIAIFKTASAFDSGSNAVRSVYDGDTFNLAFRLAHIDTPEIKGECEKEKRLAIKAKEYTKKFLLGSEKLVLTVIGTGYYGRPLVEVRSKLGYLNQQLLDNELAVQYEKGKKADWCNNSGSYI